MNNRSDTIKTIKGYSKPSDFFLEQLPGYFEQYGPYIKTSRCFNVLMGGTAGIHSRGYKRKIAGVDISCLSYALGVLRDRGLVKRRSRCVWVWTGNGGKNEF